MVEGAGAGDELGRQIDLERDAGDAVGVARRDRLDEAGGACGDAVVDRLAGGVHGGAGAADERNAHGDGADV